MVCPKSKPGKELEIHHIDLNSRNNNPDNLIEMNMYEHRKLHKELGTYYLTNAWNDLTNREKLLNGIRRYHTNVSSNSFNHKVVSITWLNELEDTGDITIESKSNSHNFALSSGIFIHNSEGRGSKVEILPGGTNLGEIDDLKYFTNKLFRALRIPSSYLPTGPDDGGSNFNDGRVGTAYIQELRFNKYCERLQGLLNEHFNNEFKLYLYERGINVDSNIFDVKFNPPQNFASYRQAEMDTVRVSTFASMVELPFMGKRFAMKRFLGLSQEEISENEACYREENFENEKPKINAGAELRSAGITSGGAALDMGAINSAGQPPEDMEGGTEEGASPIPGTAGGNEEAGGPPPS